MPVVRRHFSAAFLLALLQYLRPVSPQSNPSSTGSALPTTSTPTVYPFYNFTYPELPDHDDSGIQVSYKDTIDVSWVANGLQHSPVLQISCWTRNDTSGFIFYQNTPSYTHDLITSQNPSDPSFPLALAPYRKYSPCQLLLQDPSQTNSTEDSDSVTSVAIFISQLTNASTPGVTWNVDNPAPEAPVDAGVATAQSGSAGIGHKGVMGLMWPFVGVMVTAMVPM